MRRFHGITTRYLENYLGWRHIMERYKSAITRRLCLAEPAGRPINS